MKKRLRALMVSVLAVTNIWLIEIARANKELTRKFCYHDFFYCPVELF